MDQFYNHSKKMIVNCNFPNATSDSEVKSQIIQDYLSINLRKRALSKTMELSKSIKTVLSWHSGARSRVNLMDSKTSQLLGLKSPFKPVDTKLYASGEKK